jgi:broad specificity phosphatase PhoE
MPTITARNLTCFPSGTGGADSAPTYDGPVRTIEFRRHAEREKEADALSPQGRSHAEDVGRSVRSDYAVVFVSPAKRTAETVAWFLRGSGQQLPGHAVVPGLLSDVEDRWRSAGKAAGSSRLDAIAAEDPELVEQERDRLKFLVEELFDRVPEDGTALAVGHSPLIEAAVYGLTGVVIEPLAECQGVAVARYGPNEYRLTEFREA